MKQTRCLLLTLLLVAVTNTGCQRQDKQATLPRSGEFHKGVAVLIGFGNDHEDFEVRTDALLARLSKLGVTHVNLSFPIFQESWTATKVFAHPTLTPSDDHLVWFIKRAKAAGFAVMLRPGLDRATPGNDGWKATMKPANTSKWFASYTEAMVGYAKLAATAGASSFCIGAELTSLEGKTTEWQSLIKAVKAVYPGHLTYSFDWGSPYKIGFADKLDFLAVDAYFPLKVNDDASVNDMEKAWDPWIAKLVSALAPYRKPVVITEVGIRSVRGAQRKPGEWEQKEQETPALELQRRYYRATCTSLSPVASGIYWWAMDLENPPEEPERDLRFNPTAKPAEAEIAICFHAQPR